MSRAGAARAGPIWPAAGRCCQGRAAGARRGFTLIEFLVVLVIMGLVMGLVLPRFRGWREPGLRQVAADVAYEVRAQRLQAMRTGQVLRLDPATVAAHLPQDFALRAEGPLVLFPDGRTSGGQWSVSGGDGALRLSVDWLTGTVQVGP